MRKIFECVPNFSEGRDKNKVNLITEAIASIDNVKLLDFSLDAGHNRSVVTFIGDENSIINGAFAGIKKGMELIDMNLHNGGHPRIGAADVVPFVPIKNVTIDDCINIANKLGEMVGNELQIPVYLYEEAAKSEERKSLPNVRKGQFEGLKEELGHNDKRIPDYGPNKIHPTAGAVAIGARMPLIAYNIYLDSDDVKIAKKIAKTIRESSGGLPCVKAIGLLIDEKHLAQVSMNLTNYKTTSMRRVFEEVEKLAIDNDMGISESEIIGLIPADALDPDDVKFLKLYSYNDKQIIENHL